MSNVKIPSSNKVQIFRINERYVDIQTFDIDLEFGFRHLKFKVTSDVH